MSTSEGIETTIEMGEVMLDLSGVSENQTVPTGQYTASVEKAELTDTRSGGKMIKVQLKVLEGDHKNRMIFDQFNTENANPQAVQIGLSQLKGMMKAWGHPNPNRLESCEELLGLRGLVNVKVEEDPGYGPQARVKAYKALATAGAVGGTPAAGAPAAGGNPFA